MAQIVDELDTGVDESKAEVKTEIVVHGNATQADEEVVQSAENEVLILDTDKMDLDDFIAYMANLQTDKKKVQLDLTHVLTVCTKCFEFKTRIQSIGESNNVVAKNIEKLEDENRRYKNKEKDFVAKLKANQDDIKALKFELRTKQVEANMILEQVEELTIEVASKDKELADSRVKIAELNRKFEQFWNSENALNSLIRSQRDNSDRTGLGYNEMPPPYNHTYVPNPEMDSVAPPSVDSDDESTIAPTATPTTAPAKDIPEKVQQRSSKQIKFGTFVSAGTGENELHVEPVAVIDDTGFESKPKQQEKLKGVQTGTSESSVTSKRPMDKMTCFKCKQKGHVASVCQNERPKHVPTVAPAAIPERTQRPGLGSEAPKFPKIQQRFQPVYVQNKGPRALSPTSISSCGSTSHQNVQRNRTPPRSHTPQRSHTPSRAQYRSMNPHFVEPHQHSVVRFDQRVHTQPQYRPKTVSQGSLGSSSSTVASTSTVQPKSILKGKSSEPKGYLKDFTFVDEHGRLKTIKAWVPCDD